jgi:hypothetical protein
MIVRSLALVMLTAVTASSLLACSGGTTTVPSGNVTGDDEGEIVAAPKKPAKKPAAEPAEEEPAAAPEAAACALKRVEFGADACGKCIETSCCDEWMACEKNPECLPLIACVQKCNGEETCVGECVETHRDGANALIATSKCRAASCKAKCE